ncbi:MAG TPA: hypothetical protein VF727_01305 [Allosphingosinicella sp.]
MLLHSHISDGQIALARPVAQKPSIVPIPGTTQMSHMLNEFAAPVDGAPRS